MPPGTRIRPDKIVASVGGFVFLAGVVIIGWQLLYWLNREHWYPISLRIALIQLGIPLPRFSWFSIQRIWEVCADLPFSLYVFAFAAAIMGYAAYLTEKELRSRREREGVRPRKQLKI